MNEFKLHFVLCLIVFSGYNSTRLSLCFYLKRNTGFYFMALYIPSAVIVVVAWLGNNASGDFNDLAGVLTAQLFLFYSYISVMPKVSYIKAMDIYLMGCFVFILVALFWSAVEQHLGLRLKNSFQSTSKVMFTSNDKNHQMQKLSKTQEKCNVLLALKKCFKTCAFLLIFLLFNTVYFLVCYNFSFKKNIHF